VTSLEQTILVDVLDDSLAQTIEITKSEVVVMATGEFEGVFSC
jgi:hypothetical protein